jgi:hypothetical protein
VSKKTLESKVENIAPEGGAILLFVRSMDSAVGISVALARGADSEKTLFERFQRRIFPIYAKRHKWQSGEPLAKCVQPAIM